MLTYTDRFFEGFLKKATMVKGDRADKPEGARPRTMVASKGRVNPEPLPSVDDQASVGQHLKAEIKFEKMPKDWRKK